MQHHSHVTILAGGLMRSSGKDICWFSATKSHDEQRFPDPTFPARSQSSHPPAAIYIVGKKQFKVQGYWIYLKLFLDMSEYILVSFDFSSQSFSPNEIAKFQHPPPEFPVLPPAAIPSYVNLLSAPCRAVVLPFLQYCCAVINCRVGRCVARPSHGRCRR